MPSMPLPQPRSSTNFSGAAYLSSASRHIRVVACPPVPKARPGSSRSISRPGASGIGSQTGRMSSLSPISMGL